MTTIQTKLVISGTSHDVYPVFGEDVSLNRQRESGEMYFTEELEGTFKFVGKDFDLIESQTISTQMLFEVYRVENGVSTLFATTTFYKTDCVLDYDSKICEVKMTANDLSSLLRDGLDKTFNLVKLAPKLEQTQVKIRPIWQFYMLGDDKITNVIGNMSYELNVDSVVENETELQNTYNFRSSLNCLYYSYKNAIGYTNVSAEGKYWGVEGSNQFIGLSGFQLNLVFTGYMNVCYWSLSNGVDWLHSQEYPNAEEARAEFSIPMGGQVGGQETHGLLSKNQRFIYSRILNSLEGQDRHIGNDIYQDNLNYTKTFGVAFPTTRIIMSTGVSDEPTEWGLASNGKYFTKPVIQDGGDYDKPNVIPIGYNMWGEVSFWIVSDVALWNTYMYATKPVNIQHTIRIEDAISVLLEEIDPSIHFEADASYSEFLFGSYPFGIGSAGRHIVITPITNIKKTYYSQAAQRGDITLGQILEMLKGAYGLYWWVEEDANHLRKLRIEHMRYFRNGGSYSGDARSVIDGGDLTTIYHPRNGKPWSFGQNKISFNKEKLPERYEFSWGDDCEESFNASAIEVLSEGVTKGQVERVNISNFIPDLDLIISAPNALSDDLYAVYEVSNTGKQTYAQWIDIGDSSSEGIHIDIQNTFMSFIFLIPHYHFYNLSGDRARFYGIEYTIENGGIQGLIREKKQSVTFPCSIEAARTQGLVKTDMGEGEIRKISLNLSSLMAQADIYYDI